MDEFIQRAHDLPPELFHDIRARVFTFTPGIVKVNENYKPPAILQVNEASRAILVNKYYGETMVFEFNGPCDLYKWARSLRKSQHSLNTNIRLKVKFTEYSFKAGFTAAMLQWHESNVKQRLRKILDLSGTSIISKANRLTFGYGPPPTSIAYCYDNASMSLTEMLVDIGHLFKVPISGSPVEE